MNSNYVNATNTFSENISFNETRYLTMQNSKTNTIQFWFSVFALLVVLVTAAPFAHAQGQPNYGGYVGDHRYNPNEVTIYSECGFRGQAKAVRIGEHSKIDNLGFPNDQVSSIRVPNGYDVIIYEDSKFRGAYARLNQDIECFDRSWDNAVSSIRVSRASGGAYNPNPGYSSQRYNRAGITVDNLAFVQFSNSDLRRGNNNTWYLGGRGQTNSLTEFRLISKDASSLFLDSTVSRERLRVDLNANRVTYYSNNGLAQEYEIQQAHPGPINNNGGRPVPLPSPPVASNQPSRRISGRCFNYKAYTRGGDGGLRFHGKSNVEKFTTRAVTGNVCHSGTLTMEITKTSPSTEVVVEIQGRQFTFARNEKETRYLNNWYRKDVRLVVGN